VIEPTSGHVGQVNRKELDDEKVIVCLSFPAHEAVVLHLNTGIDFTIVLDDVVGHSKMLREAHVAHIAPKRLGPWALGAKATSFSIDAPATTWVTCIVLRACPFIPLASLTARRRLGAFTPVAWPEMGRDLHR
jgi:hypothetical protein